jgi:preprotein translocase subunit SecD
MTPNLKWKAVSILIVVLISVYGIIGAPTSWTAVKQNFADRIKLGLDLQGGTHLILQVQTQEAVSLETDQVLDHLKSDLSDKGIHYDDVRKLNDTQILVHNLATDQAGAFRDVVSENFTEWDVTPAPNEASGYVVTMRPSAIAAIDQQTMDQSVETINRRIDALGLTEPTVAPYGRGDNEIIVELPGESDPNHAKDVIQAGGQLELTKVEGDQTYPSQAQALAALGGVLPAGSELVPGDSGTSTPAQPGGESWYVVDRVPVVTGRDLRHATAEPSTENPGFFEVAFTLSTDAARRFGPFTEQNVGHQMATILDHKVIIAATIENRIEDSGRITGQFGEQRANDLALELNAGALPASIKYLEERTVGPSLGADSIRHGVQASLVSLIVVLLFMVMYYRLSGVNAVVALLLNLVILLAALGYFGAVLTLPGIAGVILTIGMGVDSNVLIFERIREELRAAKAPVSAVDLGFKRAFLTIVDTHVTTMVSALFLGVFGTGPVRGFAVTLIVGLGANLFTSVYVSRVIFDWHLAKMPRQAELSI